VVPIVSPVKFAVKLPVPEPAVTFATPAPPIVGSVEEPTTKPRALTVEEGELTFEVTVAPVVVIPLTELTAPTAAGLSS
jgi:hypothetical protein